MNSTKNLICKKGLLKNEIKNKIEKAIKDFDMLMPEDTIIVGVSGGSDSICLLDYLLKIKDEKNLKIIVAHVNHMLRGEESERDEKFVKDFCKEKKLPIKVLKINVDQESKNLSLGIEETGRKIRYDFFKELALKEIKIRKEQNANFEVKIATAHTLSDSIETLVLNLSKGTSIDGLCGIPAVRDDILFRAEDLVDEKPIKIKIIRPLINLQKSEILKYCKENDLEFVEDSSNFEDKYTRNKIRLKVLPILKNLNENLELSIARSMELFRKDSNYLNKLASKELENLKINGKENQYSLLELKKLDFAIRSRCVKKIVENFKKNIRLDFKHLNLILNMIDKETGAIMLPSKVYLKVSNNFLEILEFKEKNDEKINFSYSLKKNKIAGSFELTERKLRVIIRMVTKEEYEALLKDNKIKFKNAIDFDKIPDEEIYLRNRKEHDKFSPVNRKITKSLKKFLNEEKVLLNERNRLAILSFRDNVMWLENFGVSEKFKVNENTKRVLLLKLENMT